MFKCLHFQAIHLFTPLKLSLFIQNVKHIPHYYYGLTFQNAHFPHLTNYPFHMAKKLNACESWTGLAIGENRL